MKKPTKQHAQQVRNIAKRHGIKGCRLTAHYIYVGRQCEQVRPEVATDFLRELNIAGFVVSPAYTCGPTFDTFAVFPTNEA